MSYLGDFRLGSVIDTKFTTRQISGAPSTLTGSPPVVAAYAGSSTLESATGITLTVDFDGRTGLNHVRIDASSGNGYASAISYQLVITVGTVNGVSVVGEVVGEFSIEHRSHLMAYTPANNKLDLTSIGNVEQVELVMETDVTLSCNALSAGAITSASFAAGAINAAAVGTGAIDADALATDAVNEIADGVWDEQLSGHATAGSAGKALADGAAGGGPTAASIATAVWTDLLASADFSTASSIGKLLKDDVDATISSRLAPTVAARTLDVTTTGEAGVDWANVGGQGTTVNLSATTTNVVNTATAVTTVNGLAANVITASSIATGALTAAKFAAGAFDAVWTVTTRLLTAGTNIVLAKGTGVTGFNDLSAAQVTTACTASTPVAASVTGSVGSVAAGGITAASIATGAIDADALATDAVTELVNGVWNEPTASHTTAGTTGKALIDASAGGGGGPTAAAVATAVWTDLLAGSDFSTASSIGKLLKDDVDATISSRLAPTVAARTLDVTATGEAGMDWANIGSPTTTVNLSGTSTKAVEPTTAGRKLDISVGGEAGVDWANVGSPTTTVGLTNTTISSTQVVASVTGAVGSVTGNVGGDVTGSVGSVTGSVGSVTGPVGSVTGNVGGNVAGSVGSLGAQAKLDVNAEVVDTLNVDTYAEPSSPPAATASLVAKINWQQAIARNKITQSATQQVVRNDADTLAIGTATVSDDGTTAIRGEFA